VSAVPVGAGLHGGVDGPFTILRFTEIPAKAYVEGAAGGNHVENTRDVTRLEKNFSTLEAQALSVEDTRRLLTDYQK